MGKKRAKLFKILLAIIVVALLISTGIYFYRKADPDNQLIAIENDLTALAQDFTNQNFDAVKKHFTDDAVFVFEGSEIPYAEGIEKIKAELTSDFSIEFIMRVIRSNDGQKMKCTANGIMALDGKKSYPEYEFEFEKVSKFSWKISKMSAVRNELFNKAFGQSS